VAEMRGSLEGPLEAGAERAGRAIEGALLRAVRTGKFGLEDLKRIALSVMAEIAAAALRGGIDAIAAGGGRGPGLTSLAAALLSGLPGRATGGPVSPGRGYLVGERGPELFVPTASGRIETARPGTGRAVRISISINAPSGTEPRALSASSRQIAREVRAALMRAE
jgi:hypothetical protein